MIQVYIGIFKNNKRNEFVPKDACVEFPVKSNNFFTRLIIILLDDKYGQIALLKAVLELSDSLCDDSQRLLLAHLQLIEERITAETEYLAAELASQLFDLTIMI